MDKIDYIFGVALGFIGTILILMMFIVAPYSVWTTGHFNQQILAKYHGIEMGWFQASFISVDVSKTSVSIED
jgi:hypothetical protein